MISREAMAVTAVFISLVGISLWLQFGLLTDGNEIVVETNGNNPDYYLENFVSMGMDDRGKQYRLEADRLVHYPNEDHALLNRPRIAQYDADLVPTHIYADSGWLYSNKSDVLLIGNVKISRSQNGGAADIATSNKMYVRLKPGRK